MPKIKNWSKRSDLRWEHDKKDVRVQIVKNKRGVTGFPSYNVLRIQRGGSRYIAKEVPTKEGAEGRAVEWMRKHPQG